MTENAHRTHPPHRSILVRWDEAGNLGQVSIANRDAMFEAGRFLFWTEDCCGPRPCGANRMHAAVDDRYYSYYAYDHAGGSCGSRAQSQACLSYAEMQQRRQSQRTLKITGQCEQLDVSAWLMHTVSSLREFTVYPSPHLVLTEHGYTKHYYAGAERLAARQGDGFRRTILGESTELSEAATRLFDQALHQAPRLATPPEPHLLQEEHPDDVYNFMLKDMEIPENLDVHAEINVDEFLDAVRNLVAAGPEPDVYFYHSDHLGSASWITDKDGTPVQHLQYLPYGEPFVNQRISGYNERFTFTGKERDEETGYSYFSARYLDHEILTSFLSVDRYADKYPSISPYAYCAWNPIRLIDPTGDTLDIRGGAQAQADILSIVAPQYRDRITFQNDRVNVNVEGLSKEEIDMDAGLSILNRMTTSKYHYLYQAEEILGKDNEPVDILVHSITPRWTFWEKSNEPLPDGYHGWVVFHPNACFYERGSDECYSNRPSTVFHELEECYQRTDEKLPYMYRLNGKENPNRHGAHTTAIQKAERLTPSARSVFGTEGSAYGIKIVR